MSEWQPIESAPRDGTEIILRCTLRKAARILIGKFVHDDQYEGGGYFQPQGFLCKTVYEFSRWHPIPKDKENV